MAVSSRFSLLPETALLKPPPGVAPRRAPLSRPGGKPSAAGAPAEPCRPILYDLTRLALRAGRAVPNGIDRVDLLLASRFLAERNGPAHALLTTPLGPRLVSAARARSLLAFIARSWDGGGDASGSAAVFAALSAWLAGPAAPAVRLAAPAISRQTAAARLILGEAGALLGSGIAKALPDAVYVNASQFPTWVDGCYGWLQKRAVPGLFFIHDLLPLQMPEYFPQGESRRHARRLETLAKRGSGALVSTPEVAADLRRRMVELGRPDLPIHVAPLPVAAAFRDRAPVPPALAAANYFVLCGTIEPRKNHLLILQAWRQLVEQQGAAAPKLVLAGLRGWENEQIFDLLDRCPALQTHVIEVGGLSNTHLRQLMAGARALLMPTFAEGYGLPLYEGLASGVPVIASDIAAFREVDAEGLHLVDATDGPRWREAIEALSAAPRQSFAPPCLPDEESFFSGIERFIATLGSPRAAAGV